MRVPCRARRRSEMSGQPREADRSLASYGFGAGFVNTSSATGGVELHVGELFGRDRVPRGVPDGERHLDPVHVAVVAVVNLFRQVHQADACRHDRPSQEQTALAIETELLGDVRIRVTGEDDDLLAIDGVVGLVHGQAFVDVLESRRE